MIANVTSREVHSDFFLKAYKAAFAANHLWPAYAASEAALESSWGQSELAQRGNNLFGQKQSHPPLPGTATLVLPTHEFLHGAWQIIQSTWTLFSDWSACFDGRMNLLRSLAPHCPAYARALTANTGENFIWLVSESWSTDPNRAGKVLEIYKEYASLISLQANK